MRRTAFFLALLLFPLGLWAQTATLKGRVMDDNNEPIDGSNIILKDFNLGTQTDKDGNYSLQIPAAKNVVVTFSRLSYKQQQITKRLKEGSNFILNVSLKRRRTTIGKIEKRSSRNRTIAGSVFIDPKKAELLPTPVGGIEGLIKVLIGSKNEMTSQYAVRGGNYDENLVYINDFEVYRPFLVRSGQQEGLSIINPDLVKNVNFSTGGFEARYGDKMSSALDIQYKRPREFAGSVQLSLLGVNAHLEGAGANNRLSYMIGARQKSNQYLLQSQQTTGIYYPSFTDLQAFANYRFSDTWEMDVFANYARNRFDFQPQESTQSFGLINQAFQLQMFYQGGETDKFDSRYGGISLTNNPNPKLSLKYIASGFQTNETETYDIQGEYLLGQIETDLGKDNFGQVKFAVGTGVIHNYARNYLTVNVGNVGHKGAYDGGNHFLQWGANVEVVNIDDVLNEWERRDSAGFSQPYSADSLHIFRTYKSNANFNYQRFTAYAQDNIAFDSAGVTLTAGIRANYNGLNNELLISPRLQAAWKPVEWDKNIVFRAATGFYHQPPFYREMRDLNGNVNKDIKAQRSFHAIAGFDYNFKGMHVSPFKFTTELYYKKLWNLVPYEFDNVRIRYFGDNLARGYAYGAEFRLYGDLVKDAESWISLSFMKTGEDIINDQITFQDVNGSDSATIYPGFIPRPTDSRVNFGMFFSDYLPGNKNFKLHLSGIYGTGLPFGPPDQNRFGDTLRIPSYRRVDIGFSALLIDGKRKVRPYYSMFNNIESMWFSFEVFNLLGIRNTLSYLWIQDQTSSRTYAVPNRLTARLLNARLVVKF